MNYNSLCYRCFCEKPIPDRPCSACGYMYDPNQVKRNCLMPGTLLHNRYLVGVALGVGGFGITYKCLDTSLGGICAIKEYFPGTYATRLPQSRTVNVDPENVQRYGHVMNRFVEEAQMLKTLDHPNIIRTFDSFSENNTAYYVMEYCDGVDLRTYTKGCTKKLDSHLGIHFLKQVMDGLEYVHSKNIMHRDIAPDNIYVTKSNHVKILDFGAARREMDQNKRQLSTIVKMGYAPIEQYGNRGKQGPYTDIYALGATFYHLFTGVYPPESTTRAASDRDELVPISKLRPDLQDNLKYCIEKCLAIKSSERLQSIADMRYVLGISGGQQQWGNSGLRSGQSGQSGLRAGQSGQKGGQYGVGGSSSSGGNQTVVASISKRCLAYLIDSVIIGLFLLSFMMAAYVSGSQDGIVACVLMQPIFMFVYGTCMEMLSGATLGKLVMNIYVRGMGSGKAETSQILLRNLVKLLGVFCLIPAAEGMMLQEKITSSVVCNKFVR